MPNTITKIMVFYLTVAKVHRHLAGFLTWPTTYASSYLHSNEGPVLGLILDILTECVDSDIFYATGQ